MIVTCTVSIFPIGFRRVFGAAPCCGSVVHLCVERGMWLQPGNAAKVNLSRTPRFSCLFSFALFLLPFFVSFLICSATKQSQTSIFELLPALTW